METKPLPLTIPAGWALLIAAFWFLLLAPARKAPWPMMDGNHLRSIAQTGLIYAADNQGRLPVAEDVWDYAAELARGGGLNDAMIWLAEGDPAAAGSRSRPEMALARNSQEVDPRFLGLKPSWAVPLGELDVRMPPTMPIAWTRGLRSDGTWAPHGPYAEAGGYVVFLAGNARFFCDVKDKLTRFDGIGTTSDILEALPPGTRIGEYQPDAVERREWPAIKEREDRKRARWAEWAPVVATFVWLGVLLLMVQATFRREVPFWVWCVFFLMHLMMAAMYLPTSGKVR